MSLSFGHRKTPSGNIVVNLINTFKQKGDDRPRIARSNEILTSVSESIEKIVTHQSIIAVSN